MDSGQPTSRRSFLGLGAWACIVPLLPSAVVACAPEDVYWWRAPEGPFHHGVASGDPLADRVILWTRVSVLARERAELRWMLALDEEFNEVVAEGRGTTSAEVDFTFKVDVTGLMSQTTYYYRFNFEGTDSPVGRTRTLPREGVERVRIASVCCSNFPAGYFHGYQVLAEEEDIDVVLHLGDYLYEYASDGYASGGSRDRGRLSEPRHELLTVEDYRARYSQYRSDLSLQTCHARHPFIIVWDDHEIANNSFRTGASNHEDDEGPYVERKAAATKVWFEWMPVRPPRGGSTVIYRRFEFGDLLHLFMLDTRLVGREKQLTHGKFRTDGVTDPEEAQEAAMDESRTLLGEEQKQWLFRNLAESEARWQVLGQQVLMARYSLPVDLVDTLRTKSDSRAALLADEVIPRNLALGSQDDGLRVPYNLDSWDGYSAERDALMDLAREQGKRLVVLSGDTHNAWASQLTTQEGHPVGVELATPSLSSPGFERRLGIPVAEALAELMTLLLPDLRWANFQHRGYLLVEFTPEQVQAEFHCVSSVKEQEFHHVEEARVTLSGDLAMQVS